MEYIERLLSETQQAFTAINYWKFGINLLVTAVLAFLLGLFYVRFGNSINNRRRFSWTFLPLALTTMLIIFIVKSSVSLSLGLVGALSIVRFRAAVKDPEELVYLFLSIGIGLAAGAEQIGIAICSFVFIIAVLYVQTLLRKRSLMRNSDHMHLNLSTPHRDLAAISQILNDNFGFVELKRIDDSGQQLDLSFVVEANTLEQLDKVRTALLGLAPGTAVSIVEQRNIAV